MIYTEVSVEVKPAVIKNTAVFLFLIGEHLLSKPLEHAHYALFVSVYMLR